jgi:hypothetical protein
MSHKGPLSSWPWCYPRHGERACAEPIGGRGRRYLGCGTDSLVTGMGRASGALRACGVPPRQQEAGRWKNNKHGFFVPATMALGDGVFISRERDVWASRLRAQLPTAGDKPFSVV